MTDSFRTQTISIQTGSQLRATVEIPCYSLVVTTGPDEGTSVRAEGRLIVGRDSSCDLRLKDGSVSGRHAEIEARPDGLWVSDLSSKNGTFIDGTRIERGLLASGQHLKLGDTVVEVRDDTKPVLVLPEKEATLGDLVGDSKAMRLLFAILRRIAPTDLSILVLGETGTGKELIASTLHALSRRSQGPLEIIDGATLSGPLADSELFGHEKGAYTGAIKRHRGVFERAHGGTVFLDEIGELTPEVQARLLRVLESRTVRRLGSETSISVDIRLVCATHCDLRKMIDEGEFRRDLYFRLAEATVGVPPLRERPEDVPLLVEHLTHQIAERIGPDSQGVGFSADALEVLARCPWDGNVRELRNVVALSLATAQGRVVTKEELESILASSYGDLPLMNTEEASGDEEAGGKLYEAEKRLIQEALTRHGGNKSKAAKELGIPRTTLNDKAKRYGLE